jgi:hypothetical protein
MPTSGSWSRCAGCQRWRDLRTSSARRYHDKRGRDDDELLKGTVVGAAAVGLAVAIAKSDDD